MNCDLRYAYKHILFTKHSHQKKNENLDLFKIICVRCMYKREAKDCYYTAISVICVQYVHTVHTYIHEIEWPNFKWNDENPQITDLISVERQPPFHFIFISANTNFIMRTFGGWFLANSNNKMIN